MSTKHTIVQPTIADLFDARERAYLRGMAQENWFFWRDRLARELKAGFVPVSLQLQMLDNAAMAAGLLAKLREPVEAQP